MYEDDSIADRQMLEDYDESQDESTQAQTQSTQQASQNSYSMDDHLWGYLQPCSSTLPRIDFFRIQPVYRVGRNNDFNDIVLPGFKVSNEHCELSWNRRDGPSSSVVVLDKSSNGTFINGEKIGKGHSRILHNGNEIAFGTNLVQHANNGLEDYRYIYRHTAAGLPATGLYAYYDIGNELGKGSFATVMKAVCRATGVWYAVKMIKGKTLRNGNNQTDKRNTALTREISIMEKLRHPNICALKHVFHQDNNDINLVLELVEGGDLLEYILKCNGVDEENSKHITYQICDAMSYIHSLGVTHRDLKPENILLTLDVPPIVKIADFGLAKIVDSLTMLHTMCGTPTYLAPEVVQQVDHEGYDNLVDSWSIGVILFSMMTNTGPFIEDEGQRDIRIRIATRTIHWDHLNERKISSLAKHFISRLLEADPLLRMTMAESLEHEWLLSYTQIYTHAEIYQKSPVPPPKDFIIDAEAGPSGAPSGMNEDLSTMEVQTPANAPETRRSQPPPLQRRSEVLSRAAEGGGPVIPEPSWEMIAHASQQQEAAESSSKGQNKRVHAQLTPLPEELAADAEMDGSPDTAAPVVKDDDISKARNSERGGSQPRRSTRPSKLARRGA